MVGPGFRRDDSSVWAMSVSLVGRVKPGAAGRNPPFGDGRRVALRSTRPTVSW